VYQFLYLYSVRLKIKHYFFQVYWIPPDSEEKLEVSMTVLLAFSVILYVVNDLTPASSDQTPIVG